MVIKFLRKIRQKRNFWFLAKFDEMSILYIAKMFRSFALNISAGFVLMYFYKIGYGWNGVLLFLILSYVVKLISVWVGGAYIAKHGPKHGILLSNILNIPMLIMASLTSKFGVSMAIATMIIQGLAISIYNVSIYVGMSKVKNNKKAGGQLGVLYSIDKIAAALSPIIGGWLAIFIGMESALYISAILFVMSAIPLLSTREVMKNDIKLNFKTFPVKKYLNKIFIPQTLTSGPSSTVHFTWRIFVPVFIFSQVNSYGVIASLASLSAIVSIIAAIAFGKIVDKNQGGIMLRGSIFIRGLINLCRGLFMMSPLAVVLTNIADEVSGVGYSLSNQKGAFFEADDSGRRIEYFVISESFFFIGSTLYTILAFVLFSAFGAETGLRIFFAVSGVVLILLGRIKYTVYEIK